MDETLPPEVMETVRRTWGFTSLRALQTRAIAASVAGRDSLVVLPTGGGKSLCYQAPAVALGRTTVVVSPLIALMKDQTDALRELGVNAIRFDSTQTAEERAEAERQLRTGKVPLIFASPERLSSSWFTRLISDSCRIEAVAIDEAHCISEWGHDFRPEYRQLGRLRDHFPYAAINAYTATATPRVRDDIVRQLELREPVRLVGEFDRPNLTYRVLPKIDFRKQLLEVIERRKSGAGIIYCMTRDDVESTALYLSKLGYSAIGYHAGMGRDARTEAQNRFRSDEAPIVAATNAFGMGIDRPDVRFVVHASMPKSVESYQQEAGRAGRDGQPAECVLFYSHTEVYRLRRILEQPGGPIPPDPIAIEISLEQVRLMERYCRSAICRHRALVQHFGQEYPQHECHACDICLHDVEVMPDSIPIAQKILSCIARTKESFGAAYVAQVLRGEKAGTIKTRGHDTLSTYGLLKEHGQGEIIDWTHQLIEQGFLLRTDDEFPKLKLNKMSWSLMKGEAEVKLLRLSQPIKLVKRRRAAATTAPSQAASPYPVQQYGDGEYDPGLYDELRRLRKELADLKGVPAYMVFPDRVLIEMATVRPTQEYGLREISGIGERKLQEFGGRFLDVIRDHVGEMKSQRVVTRFTITLPNPDAELVVEGRRMETQGQIRTIETTELDPGEEYEYEIGTRWRTADGKVHAIRRTVPFSAGSQVAVDLTRAEPEDVVSMREGS